MESTLDRLTASLRFSSSTLLVDLNEVARRHASERERSKTHEVEMPIDGANILTIRDGKLSRLEMFLDQSEALEAAGLTE